MPIIWVMNQTDKLPIRPALWPKLVASTNGGTGGAQAYWQHVLFDLHISFLICESVNERSESGPKNYPKSAINILDNRAANQTVDYNFLNHGYFNINRLNWNILSLLHSEIRENRTNIASNAICSVYCKYIKPSVVCQGNFKLLQGHKVVYSVWSYSFFSLKSRRKQFHTLKLHFIIGRSW